MSGRRRALYYVGWHMKSALRKRIDVIGSAQTPGPAMSASNHSSPGLSPPEVSSPECTSSLENPSGLGKEPSSGSKQLGETESVHVRFEPSEGRRLQRSEPTTCPGEEPLWERRPVLMKRADGTYELIGTSGNLKGLSRWILSFGPQAEVRCPDQLRRRVAVEARRIWRQYNET